MNAATGLSAAGVIVAMVGTDASVWVWRWCFDAASRPGVSHVASVGFELDVSERVCE
jgi:hypothetical protein